jgi:hypothetical protein
MQTKSQLLGFSSDERRQADEGQHDLSKAGAAPHPALRATLSP